MRLKAYAESDLIICVKIMRKIIDLFPRSVWQLPDTNKHNNTVILEHKDLLHALRSLKIWLKHSICSTCLHIGITPPQEWQVGSPPPQL